MFMALRGALWRLSKEDDRIIQDMTGSGGCVNSLPVRFVFTEKSDEVLESQEAMRSAEEKEETNPLCICWNR